MTLVASAKPNYDAESIRVQMAAAQEEARVKRARMHAVPEWPGIGIPKARPMCKKATAPAQAAPLHMLLPLGSRRPATAKPLPLTGKWPAPHRVRPPLGCVVRPRGSVAVAAQGQEGLWLKTVFRKF